jgi:3-isopropylmalate/(R)-2-methylmalate dehydratase small subunit
VATGELYPVEAAKPIVQDFQTDDEVVLDLDAGTLLNRRTGDTHAIKSLGDAGPVIDAGGLFKYARQTGMIPGGR